MLRFVTCKDHSPLFCWRERPLVAKQENLLYCFFPEQNVHERDARASRGSSNEIN